MFFPSVSISQVSVCLWSVCGSTVNRDKYYYTERTLIKISRSFPLSLVKLDVLLWYNLFFFTCRHNFRILHQGFLLSKISSLADANLSNPGIQADTELQVTL